MQYINPIEILGLSNVTDTTSIDNEIIKKAKRKLFADIDLSDNGFFEYYGLQLTKGDCEKVIDELTNNDLKEFHFFLAINKNFNSFLINGDLDNEKKGLQGNTHKLPDFVKFVSPYFAPKFDKALLKAFESNNLEKTKSILNTAYLILPDEINIAYKGVSNHIQNKISEIDEITKDIENEESVYDEDDIGEVVDVVKEHFPAETLNCLPQYFQSQILKIAKSINYLSNAIWDTFETTQVPNDLTEYLLTLNIGGLDRPTFEKNFGIISKKNNERIEQTKNAPLLQKWAEILSRIKKDITEVENNTTNSNLVFDNLKNLFSINELNNLPSFANEIRSQIGYSIRSLSIAMWNKQNDIRSALNAINLALEINIDNEAKLKFEQDKTELNRLEKENKGILICHFCDKNVPDKTSQISKTIYKETYRSYFPRRVQFSQYIINIPRCKSCEKIHSKGSSELGKYFIIGIIAGVIIGAIADEHFILGGVIGAGIGWIIGEIYKSKEISKNNIKNTSESTLSKHPVLIEEFRNGWKFSKPSA
jgi:hypothetical protein